MDNEKFGIILLAMFLIFIVIMGKMSFTHFEQQRDAFIKAGYEYSQNNTWIKSSPK